MENLDMFTEAFITCSLWSSTYEHDDCEACREGQCNPPCDDGEHELSSDARATLEAYARTFWTQYGAFCTAAQTTAEETEAGAAAQAGHDFWLTSQGHGAGFWDGDWREPYADMLTKASKAILGERNFYVNNEGELDLM